MSTQLPRYGGGLCDRTVLANINNNNKTNKKRGKENSNDNNGLVQRRTIRDFFSTPSSGRADKAAMTTSREADSAGTPSTVASSPSSSDVENGTTPAQPLDRAATKPRPRFVGTPPSPPDGSDGDGPPTRTATAPQRQSISPSSNNAATNDESTAASTSTTPPSPFRPRDDRRRGRFIGTPPSPSSRAASSSGDAPRPSPPSSTDAVAWVGRSDDDGMASSFARGGGGMTAASVPGIDVSGTPPSPEAADGPRPDRQAETRANRRHRRDGQPSALQQQLSGPVPSPRKRRRSATVLSSQRRRPQQQRQLHQLYLDFGQSSFGRRTICPVCGMLRVHGVAEDESQHDAVCREYAEGVSFPGGWRQERVVARGVSSMSSAVQGDDWRIVEIRPNDPVQHRKKVLQVKNIVDQELGFVPTSVSSSFGGGHNASSGGGGDDVDDAFSLRGKTAFLMVEKKRVVGFCSVEIVRRAYKLLPIPGDGRLLDHSRDNEGKGAVAAQSQNRSLESYRSLMGVHQIWCHRLRREAGIASRLCDAARERLVFGMTVPLEMVAFSSPTADGSRFAIRYTGVDAPLVYDCR